MCWILNRPKEEERSEVNGRGHYCTEGKHALSVSMLEGRTRQSQNTLDATVYLGLFKTMQECIQAQITLYHSGARSTSLQIPVNGVVCCAR